MTLFTTYHEAIEWIHSRLAFGVKPGLERMKWLMDRLDHPEQKIKAVHVVEQMEKDQRLHLLDPFYSQRAIQLEPSPLHLF